MKCSIYCGLVRTRIIAYTVVNLFNPHFKLPFFYSDFSIERFYLDASILVGKLLSSFDIHPFMIWITSFFANTSLANIYKSNTIKKKRQFTKHRYPHNYPNYCYKNNVIHSTNVPLRNVNLHFYSSLCHNSKALRK